MAASLRSDNWATKSLLRSVIAPPRRSSDLTRSRLRVNQGRSAPLVGERTGEQHETNREERADTPHRLEVCEIDEEDLPDSECEKAEPREPDCSLSPDESGNNRGEAKTAPEAGQSELRRLRRDLRVRPGQPDEKSAREIDEQRGGNPCHRLPDFLVGPRDTGKRAEYE